MNISNSSLNVHAPSEGRRNNQVKTFLLPDQCFENRIGLAWRHGNKFAIYPRGQPAQQNVATKSENKIVLVRQEIVLFTPIARRLINESNECYINLQNAAEVAKSSDNQLEMLKISRHYRSVLRACLETIRADNADGVAKDDLLSYETILYSIECIWHLAEILFIDSIPGDVVLPFLLEWTRLHCSRHDLIATEFLNACEKGSESHQEYWETVLGMVVQGRIDIARTLLKLHTLYESNEFRLIDNALKTMPVFSVYGGISAGEFTISWKRWQAETRAKLNSRAVSSQPNLEFILRVVTGDYSAFESLRDKYESWIDLFGAWVMYTCPTARRHELSEPAHACAGMRTRHGSNNHLDLVVLALCECDLHQVLHEIQNMSDNGWFATHFTDLLYHTGKLRIIDKHQLNVTHRFRESLILEYGSLLFEHKSLWSVGLSYLMRCGVVEGARRAELLLERLPIRDQRHALKVITEARRYGLHSVARSVCLCEGARQLSRGRGPAALAWAARAGAAGAALAGRAAERELQQYRARRPAAVAAPDLLLTLGGHILLHERLLFLGKYCEFHKSYGDREFKNAGKLLISLLTSKIAPDYFWDTLLLDTLPLLESDDIIFSSKDTSEIMLCLEIQANTLDQEQRDLLRLALTRNLARACLSADDVEAD